MVRGEGMVDDGAGRDAEESRLGVAACSKGDSGEVREAGGGVDEEGEGWGGVVEWLALGGDD